MHHYAYAEIAPLAPALPAAGEGLAALFPLIAWGICLSLLYIWRRSVGAIFEHLANLLDAAAVHVLHVTVRPFGFVAAELRRVDYAVQAALDAGAKATERATVYLFHKSMATFAMVGHELAALSHATATALLHLTTTTIPREVRAGTNALAHELHALPGQIDRRTHALLRPLEREIHRSAVAAEQEFDLLRGRFGRVGRRVGRLEREAQGYAARLTRLEKLLAAGVLVGIVSRALERILGSWIRCPSLRRIGKRVGCGGFGFLEDLLFGVVEVFAVSDLCRFAGLATATAEAIRPLLIEFVDFEEALVGCHGATRPPNLSIPRLHLPPANAGLTLAA